MSAQARHAGFKSLRAHHPSPSYTPVFITNKTGKTFNFCHTVYVMVQKQKILLVDDNDFILVMLERYIAELNAYETFKASNAKEALSHIQTQDFDLIITDVIMPEKDGIQLINEIRAMNKHMPVIVVSGGDESGEIDNYINFAGYFSSETLKKPFTKQELKSAIDMALGFENVDVLEFL